jgi:hypothetical protein
MEGFGDELWLKKRYKESQSFVQIVVLFFYILIGVMAFNTI